MPLGFRYRALVLALAACVVFSGGAPALSQTVWSGYDFTFTKPNFAQPTNPQYQDRITDSIWITRGVNQPIYNIESEAGYGASSPAGTRWATYLNNPGETIAAANYANLAVFEDFVTAFGGPGTLMFPERVTGGDAVLHLIEENIYLDIRFTIWGGTGTGAFSYDRGMAPPVTSPSGDYNDNGTVDAADYVLWRNTLNESATPPGSGADGDESGTIDDVDYTYWRSRFGNSAPGSAAAALVPEPSALVTLLIGALGASVRRPRRPRRPLLNSHAKVAM